MNEQEIKAAALKAALKVFLILLCGGGLSLLLLYLRAILKHGFADPDKMLFVAGGLLLFAIGVAVYSYFEDIKTLRSLSKRMKKEG